MHFTFPYSVFRTTRDGSSAVGEVLESVTRSRSDLFCFFKVFTQLRFPSYLPSTAVAADSPSPRLAAPDGKGVGL